MSFWTRLKQLWVPKPFRLPKPRFSGGQIDLLEELIQLIHPSISLAESANQDDKTHLAQFLVDLGTGIWRIKKKIESLGRMPKEIRDALFSLESTWKSMSEGGVEIVDHIGVVPSPEEARIVEVRTIPNIAREQVIEATRPTILLKGEVIQVGEVILGRPAAAPPKAEVLPIVEKEEDADRAPEPSYWQQSDARRELSASGAEETYVAEMRIDDSEPIEPDERIEEIAEDAVQAEEPEEYEPELEPEVSVAAEIIGDDAEADDELEREISADAAQDLENLQQMLQKAKQDEAAQESPENIEEDPAQEEPQEIQEIIEEVQVEEVQVEEVQEEIKETLEPEPFSVVDAIVRAPEPQDEEPAEDDRGFVRDVPTAYETAISEEEEKPKKKRVRIVKKPKAQAELAESTSDDDRPKKRRVRVKRKADAEDEADA